MTTPATADLFPPELIHLTATAIEILDKHLNQGGRCTACPGPWPCQPAQLAEHNLAGL